MGWVVSDGREAGTRRGPGGAVRARRAAVLLGAAVLAAGAAGADEPVRIVAPGERTIVVGPTAVVVEGPPGLAYRVFRRSTPGTRGTLVCSVDGPPRGESCTFDAGRDLASERLLVEAVDPTGRVVARDETETYFFQRPELTISRPTNPVVEVGIEGEQDAVRRLLDDPSLIGCRIGDGACRVTSIRRSRDAGLLRMTLLVDESNSIGREGLDRLLPAIESFIGMVEIATGGAVSVEYEVLFFSETVRSATFGFTADVAEVQEALLTGAPSGGTCLYRAMSRVLRDLEFWKAKDRWARRVASDALVVWSDGQDACPPNMTVFRADGSAPALTPPALPRDRAAGAAPPSAKAAPRGAMLSFAAPEEAAAALDDARWSDVPIYVVPVAMREPCPLGCFPDPAFLELGTVSGGETYDGERPLHELLTEEIFDDLLSRHLVEIQPGSLDLLDSPRALQLSAAGDVTLRHRAIIGERRTRRQTALEILRTETSDIEAKAAAASVLSRDPARFRIGEAELIYRGLERFIREVGRDLEAQAREAGRDELARYLRARRRSAGNMLTRRELAIVRMLGPEDRKTFMRARNAMLEAIVTACGRALLWDDDPRRHRRFLRLVERMTADGYWLTNPAGRLRIFLGAYLDDDVASDPRTRARAAALLGA